MSRTIIYPFHTWWAFILGNLALGVIIALLFFNFPYSIERMVISTIWSASISISQWLGHSYIQGQIGKKYNWLQFPAQRFIWTVVSVVVYSVFAYAIVQVVMNWLVLGIPPREALSEDWSFWIIPISISFLISMVTGSIGFFVNWKKSEIKQEQLKSEMLNYKYESLKNQINPHFMFNSLNVLSELVYDNQELAVRFIQQFSDIYRYVLESKNHELRLLEDEIIFVEKFVFLLKIRFEDKLNVEIDVEKRENELIVPLALQLLIENAVKHNEISTEFPLKIQIYKDDDWLIVKNKIHLKTSPNASSKIGLKNLEQQYQFFDKHIIIDNDSNYFTVKIPILRTS